MIRNLAWVVPLSIASNLAAAPVPTVSPADAVLARVTVEHVGSALAQPGLRKELTLTAEQEKKFAALRGEFEAKFKKVGGPEVVNGPVVPGVEIERYMVMAVVVAEFDTEAVKLLTAAQHRRLRQVQLQKGGPAGLFNRHVLRALAPTVKQEEAMARELAKYKRVTALSEEMIAVLSMSLAETPDTPDGIGKVEYLVGTETGKVIRDFIRKEIESQVTVREAMLRHLTAEQRATWDALTGAPLKGEELLRAGSMFGDAKVVRVLMRPRIEQGPMAQPPAQAVPSPQQPPPGK